jgi:hypothetical protein
VEFSVISGCLIAALCACLVAVMLWTRPWPKRAMTFARQWRLPLTPEVADWVAARLRVQMVATLAAFGIIGGLAFGGLAYLLVSSGPGGVAFALTGSEMLGLWIINPICVVVGHAIDGAVAGRQAGPRVARLTVPALADFIPGPLIWLVRATWLLPLAATALWLTVPAGRSSRFWPHHFSAIVIGIAVAAPVVGLAVELWQRRIVRGPQRASSGLALAYDDAFRAATVHQLALVGVWFAGLATNVIAVAPLQAGHGSPHVYVGIVLLPIAAGLAVQLAVLTQWVRQWFRVRLAPSLAGPASALNSGPASSQAAV